MPEPDAMTPDLDAAFAALGRQISLHVAISATETVVARGRRRVAVRAAAVAVAVLAVLGTGAVTFVRFDRHAVPFISVAVPVWDVGGQGTSTSLPRTWPA